MPGGLILPGRGLAGPREMVPKLGQPGLVSTLVSRRLVCVPALVASVCCAVVLVWWCWRDAGVMLVQRW